jgi:hypothetical protein
VLEVDSCRAGYISEMKTQRRLRRTPDYWRTQRRCACHARRPN